MKWHKFTCRSCEREVGVSTEAIGKRAPCPLCGKVITIPTAEQDRQFKKQAAAQRAAEEQRQAEEARVKADEQLRTKALLKQSAQEYKEERKRAKEQKQIEEQERIAKWRAERQRENATREVAYALKAEIPPPAKKPTALPPPDDPTDSVSILMGFTIFGIVISSLTILAGFVTMESVGGILIAIGFGSLFSAVMLHAIMRVFTSMAKNLHAILIRIEHNSIRSKREDIQEQTATQPLPAPPTQTAVTLEQRT